MNATSILGRLNCATIASPFEIADSIVSKNDLGSVTIDFEFFSDRSALLIKGASEPEAHSRSSQSPFRASRSNSAGKSTDTVVDLEVVSIEETGG